MLIQGKVPAEMHYSQITAIDDRQLIQAPPGATNFTVPSFKYVIVTRDPNTGLPTATNHKHVQATYPLPDLLASNNTAYVSINAAGELVYQVNAHNPLELDTVIPLGILTTLDNTTVQRSQTIYLDSSPNTKNVLAAGPKNINNTVRVIPNADLSFDISGGFVQRAGTNFANDVAREHIADIAAQSPAMFFYINSLGVVEPVPKTALDVSLYDDNGTLTNVPTGGTRTVVEEVFISSNGQVFILRPQGFANNFNQGVQRWYIYNRSRPAILNAFIKLGIFVRVSKGTDLTDENQVVFTNYFCD